MANIIIQVSKYLIIILMAAYTFSCFSIFTRSYEDEENKVLIRQDVLLFMIQITAFIAMYFATQDLRMMFIYGALAVIVMDQGVVVEDESPRELFENPKHERTKNFLSKVL